MNAALRHTVLILMAWLMVAGVCYGKQVYLKDGGIIDAQSAWRKGNRVYVKVNRDILTDFTAGEIDLRRTFPKSSHRRVKHSAVTMSEPAPSTPAATTAKAGQKPAAPPHQPSAKPAVQPAPTPVQKAAPAPPPPAPVAQEASQPAAIASPAATPDKAELQRRSQEAAKMMAEAILSKDSEKMKKALEMQKSAMPQQPGAPAPVKPAVSMTFIVFLLALGILIIAGQWVVFQKARVAGWKCLIPFYNAYILMQIAGKPGWWMFLLLIPLVGVAIMLFAMLSLAKKFGRSELFGAGLLLLPMIFFPLLAFGGSEYEG
jgi:hypothetical protein